MSSLKIASNLIGQKCWFNSNLADICRLTDLNNERSPTLPVKAANLDTYSFRNDFLEGIIIAMWLDRDGDLIVGVKETNDIQIQGQNRNFYRVYEIDIDCILLD